MTDDDESRHSSDTQTTAESPSTASDLAPETLDMANGKHDESGVELQLQQLELSSHEQVKRLMDENAELARKLQAAEKDRQNSESQYKSLLGKVSHIRSTLGERLKTDSVEIARQKTSLEYLEQKCKNLTETVTALQQEVITSSEESDRLSKELASLRQSSVAAQESWHKERGEMVAKEQQLVLKLRDAERSAEDWNVIATEEKTVRIAMSERVAELEEQLTGLKEMHDGLMKENTENAEKVSSLRQAIDGLQDERKAELHAVVEKMQAQIDSLSDDKSALTETVHDLKTQLESATADLERMRPFEKEVKEKSLLIGKLRHEAVILNEHLTKALRLLRKGTPDESVDRQLITNLLLSFLTLPRSDTKRFEILQLIAACLSWNDEQKTMAGLMKPNGMQ